MKSIFFSTKAFIIAIIGLIGGVAWSVISHWELEPLILIAVSVVEIIAFLFLGQEKNESIESTERSLITSDTSVNINVNLGAEGSLSSNERKSFVGQEDIQDREAKIDYMKSRAKVLFIDDDKNFNVVKLLKNSGWKNTKSITDTRSIDSPLLKDSQIFFVDINGVGKLLELPHEGLDLALMIKQRYPNKKVVIYSANRNTNAFHDAWDIIDFKLEKNALPNQFQNLVENYSVELFNDK